MKKYIDCDVAIRDIANRLNITKPDGTPYRKEDIETFVESLVAPIPSSDVVARDCYNRVLKENDVMREQLAKIGKKPGDIMDDVKREKRGKWEEHNYDPEYLICDFSCSECGVYLEEYYFGEGQWPGKTDHYFCSNCGADMREVTDES